MIILMLLAMGITGNSGAQQIWQQDFYLTMGVADTQYVVFDLTGQHDLTGNFALQLLSNDQTVSGTTAVMSYGTSMRDTTEIRTLAEYTVIAGINGLDLWSGNTLYVHQIYPEPAGFLLLKVQSATTGYTVWGKVWGR